MGAARVPRAPQPAPRAHQDTVIGLVGEVTRGRGWVVTPRLTRLPGRDSAAGPRILAQDRKGSGTSQPSAAKESRFERALLILNMVKDPPPKP